MSADGHVVLQHPQPLLPLIRRESNMMLSAIAAATINPIIICSDVIVRSCGAGPPGG